MVDALQTKYVMDIVAFHIPNIAVMVSLNPENNVTLVVQAVKEHALQERFVRVIVCVCHSKQEEQQTLLL